MAAGTSPIFIATPKNYFATLSVTANTATDGTGTTSLLVTAGSNGSKIEDVTIIASGAATATVVRFFLNNGSTPSSAANNVLIHEETFATVASLSQTAASVSNTWRANLVMQAGYRLYVTQGTTTATALQVCAVGGDY